MVKPVDLVQRYVFRYRVPGGRSIRRDEIEVELVRDDEGQIVCVASLGNAFVRQEAYGWEESHALNTLLNQLGYDKLEVV